MRSIKSLAVGLSIATLTVPSSSFSRPFDKGYGKLPMSFEQNVGQIRPGVDFIARGSGYSVFLSSAEAVLALKKQAQEEEGGAPRSAWDW